MPLAFRASGSISNGDLRLESRMVWSWGLLSAAIGIKGNKTLVLLKLAGLQLPLPRGKYRKEKEGHLKKKAGREGEKGGFSISAVSTVLNRKLLSTVLEYIKGIFGSLRLRLRLTGVFGTDDPALTGAILGFAAALCADKANIDLNADFSGPIIDVAGEISGRVVPIVILWLTIRLLLAGQVRKLWWAWFKSKLTTKKHKEVAQHV
jgi:hypothetical protein